MEATPRARPEAPVSGDRAGAAPDTPPGQTIRSAAAPPEKSANETARAASGQTDDLLRFIRALEAPRGYDDYERRIPIPPPRPLTGMRLGAVLDWQRAVRAAGAPSSAAGGYQIIYPTLARLVRDHGLATDSVFDAAFQDRLARLLIAECGPRPDRRLTSAHPGFGNCLAGIWAALPLTSGAGRGRSAHHGVAGNRALTTPETVLALLAGQAVALPTHRPARSVGSAQSAGADQRDAPLAFGALRVDAVNSALQSVQGTGRLTPSLRTWSLDPYASN